MLTVIVYDEQSDWNNLLDQFETWDFGHSYEFHALSERNGEGSPILFAVLDEFNRPVMIWPGLLRKIKDTFLLDMTSVYGYSGPIIKNKNRREECLKVVFDKMHEIGIVDVFSRMHPILGSHFSEPTDDFIESGSIVLIDLKGQRATLESYGSGLRYDIKKLKQSGVHVEVDDACRYLDDFHAIYTDAMKNLHAYDYYLFSKNYLTDLTQMPKSEVSLIFAKYENKKIGAGLFVVTNSIMQYYLGGVVEKFRQLSPLKVILEAAHQQALDKELRYLVLGGGVGSQQDDLFRFKCRFGRTVIPFYLIKKVIDADAYTRLCSVEGREPDSGGFFPTYRAPFVDVFE